MNAANLATVLGPNLIFPPKNSARGDIVMGNGIVELFIDDYDAIFLVAYLHFRS
jgi:hypothetical protein